MRALWLIGLLVVVPAGVSQRQEIGVHVPVVKAHSLSGVIKDAKGKPIGEAKADLMDCYTDKLTKRSLADADGKFLLTKGWDSTEYCLRFSQDGYKTVEIRVKLVDMAGDIQVSLPGDETQKPMSTPTADKSRVK